jgi:flagellar protein FlaG
MSIDFMGNIDPQKINLAKRSFHVQRTPGALKTAAEEQPVLKNTSQDGKEAINQAIEKLRDLGDLFNRRLDFRMDQETHRVVVKVIDTETDKVIKEIPPEQVLRLAAKIQEMIGLLVDEER